MTIYCPCCATPLTLAGLVADGGPGMWEAKLTCEGPCTEDAGIAGFHPTLDVRPVSIEEAAAVLAERDGVAV